MSWPVDGKQANALGPTDDAEKRMKSLGETVKNLGIGAALATGVNMATRAFFGLVDQMDDAYKASQKLGLSVEAFTGLSYAAKLADVDTEAFTASIYSNGVYNSPKMFAFAKGAGVFAEDGAEAIMPLKRGPDGSLGVQSSGGQGDMIVVINNESRAEVMPGKESTGADGKRMIEIWVRDAVSKGFSSGAFDGTMNNLYGLNRRGAF